MSSPARGAETPAHQRTYMLIQVAESLNKAFTLLRGGGIGEREGLFFVFPRINLKVRSF